MSVDVTKLYEYEDLGGGNFSFTRFNHVELRNPNQGIPYGSFTKEKVFHMSNGTEVTQQMNTVEMEMPGMSTTFPLLDPSTGGKVMDATIAMYYGMTYGLGVYIDLANKAKQQT